MRKDSFEIEGKRYVTTKVMAGFWDVKQGTVADYCKNGLVSGAFKDSSNRWMIPNDARKPPDKNALAQILWLGLQLKNNPAQTADFTGTGVRAENVLELFRYLERLSMVNPGFEKYDADEIPYKVSLTQKGMDFARMASGKQSSVKAKDILQLITAFAKLAGDIAGKLS